jgi:hypothetical protein
MAHVMQLHYAGGGQGGHGPHEMQLPCAGGV